MMKIHEMNCYQAEEQRFGLFFLFEIANPPQVVRQQSSILYYRYL